MQKSKEKLWPTRETVELARKRGQRTLSRVNREKALKVRYGMLARYPGPGSRTDANVRSV
jgi:hypothetical protein